MTNGDQHGTAGPRTWDQSVRCDLPQPLLMKCPCPSPKGITTRGPK